MNKAAFDKIVKDTGATITTRPDDPRMIDMEAEAPAGKVWSASSTHVVVASVYRGAGATGMVYDLLAADMLGGVEDCDTPNCEWCNGE